MASRTSWACLATLSILAACDAPASQPDNHRYQMLSETPSSGIYVLDTRTGQIARCLTTMDYRTWCSTPADAMKGAGPPPMITLPH